MADRKKFQGVIRLREKGKVAVRGKILAGVMTAPQMAATGTDRGGVR
jgi:anaerobic sulfite reductase subunit C